MGADAITGDDAPSDTVDTEGETEVSGYSALAMTYDAMVLARFAEAKRYPPRARAQRLEGHVGIEFTLSASGALIEAEIVESSGHRALDRAVLRQIERVSPFPPRTDGLTWQQRTYRTEVRFSLREA